MHRQTHLRTHTQPKSNYYTYRCGSLKRAIIKKEEIFCISRKHTIRYHILYITTVKYTLQQCNFLENIMRNWEIVLNLRNNKILVETDAINANMPY